MLLLLLADAHSQYRMDRAVTTFSFGSYSCDYVIIPAYSRPCIYVRKERECTNVLFQSSLRTNVFWPAGHYLHQYSHSCCGYG